MDKLMDFVTEFAVEQVKELAKEGKAQRLLLACFEKYIEEEAKNERRENNCCLDKEAILSLNINKISPNLEAEQIRENLKSLFEKCIRTDDDEQRKSIELRICYDYISVAKKELLELHHLNENIHDVKKEVLRNREINKKELEEIFQNYKQCIFDKQSVDKQSIQNKIRHLFKRYEMDEAKKFLQDFETYVDTEEEKFFLDLFFGAYYAIVAEENVNNTQKRDLLINSINCLDKAYDNRKSAESKDLYDLIYYYINVCNMLGMLENTAVYYKKGIEAYENFDLDNITNNTSREERYRLLLDYGVLLHEYSQFCDAKEERACLKKEYDCYVIIGTVEELINEGLPNELAYRFFNNFARCCERLIEISFEIDEKLKQAVIELYTNALDSELVTLKYTPERYGVVYNNFGNFYAKFASETSDYSIFEKAQECYDNALVAYKNLGNDVEYYRCYSNKAVLLSHKYFKFGQKKDYKEVKEILQEIIDKRRERGDVNGSYYSKIQLAQLYTFAARKRFEEKKIKKAINLYEEALKYFEETDTPDMYYKVTFLKYQAYLYLYAYLKNKEKIVLVINDVNALLYEKKEKISFDIIRKYADLLSDAFFYLIELADQIEVDTIYEQIKNCLEEVGLDINTYIKDIS